MAKRSKYSTALFEVITNARKPEKPMGKPRGVMALATPNWWFKGRGTAGIAAADPSPEPPPAPYDPDDPTARVTAAALSARAAIRTVVPTPAVAPAEPWAAPAAVTAPAIAPEDEEEAEALAAKAFIAAVKGPDEARPADPGPATAAAHLGAAPASEASRSSPEAHRPVLSRPGLKVALHPERQEVTLRLRYTSAIVGGFALLVAVGLAYVFGRRMAEGPPPARAAAVSPSSADVRKGAANRGVLDVGRARPAGGQIRARRAGEVASPTAPRPVLPPLPPAPERVLPPESAVYFDAALVNGAARRQANLNYAAIVSFPPEMRDRALAARDYLNKNGLTCTVESVPRVTSDKRWHVVVGVRGFPARYSRLPEYNEYIETIKGIGNQFAGRFTYDRFKPTMFKWE